MKDTFVVGKQRNLITSGKPATLKHLLLGTDMWTHFLDEPLGNNISWNAENYLVQLKAIF
jgi:hypothetical protein